MDKLSAIEIRIIKVLREPIDFETIEVRKSKNGKIKRITIHREHDVHLEDEETK